MFVDALAYRNRFGLPSEDIDPRTGTLWEISADLLNGRRLILTAIRLSRSWEDRYWRADHGVEPRAVPSRDGANPAGGLAVAVRSS